MSESITRGAAAAALLITATLASRVAASDKVAVFGRWVDAEEAAAAAAAMPEPPEAKAPDWGAANSIYSIGACDAGIRDATHTYRATSCDRVEPIIGQTSTSIGFPVHLPSGAGVTAIKLNYYDTHIDRPSLGFYRVNTVGTTAGLGGFNLPVFAGGNATNTITLNHTVNNLGGSYMILVILPAEANGATGTGIYGFEISYHLQVSAAPATATFPNDVPTNHPFFRFVEAMAASGLTGGCAAGSFCPDTAVTRGQLSVFLAVALGLHFPN